MFLAWGTTTSLRGLIFMAWAGNGCAIEGTIVVWHYFYELRVEELAVRSLCNSPHSLH